MRLYGIIWDSYAHFTYLDGLRVLKQNRKKKRLIMAARGAGRWRFRGEAARWDFSETSHDVAIGLLTPQGLPWPARISRSCLKEAFQRAHKGSSEFFRPLLRYPSIPILQLFFGQPDVRFDVCASVHPLQ